MDDAKPRRQKAWLPAAFRIAFTWRGAEILTFLHINTLKPAVSLLREHINLC
jgi:hypothetical protein